MRIGNICLTVVFMQCAAVAVATADAQPEPVTYEQFGARGDGQTNDMEAIEKAHAFANREHRPVRADDTKTYYIGTIRRSAIIKTDTDFGKAHFVIDDRDVFKERGKPVFIIDSSHRPYKLTDLAPLRRNQTNIGQTLRQPALIRLTDANVKRYIRYGANQNNGSSQTDVILVDRDGNIDMKAPLIWDFNAYTDVTVTPLDEKLLTVSGGIFTTIANQAPSKYTYYARNITVRRSNVRITGLRHEVTGELDHGAPYNGFLAVNGCANVTIERCVLTGRKMYGTIGSAKVPVNMGSYDLTANSAINIIFRDCTQTNDILDRAYWGIFGSNYCKNLVYDGCVLSRFDAHMGVANATIRNSRLGHMGINAIGTGTFLVENSTVQSYALINLRSDYGSTWEGDVIIRNCTFISRGSLINGSYSGKHDFGYPCFMPQRILVDGLRVHDGEPRDNYRGLPIFANFNKANTSDAYIEKFPYHKTEEVILRNVTTTSGQPLRLSDNAFMFKDVKVVRD